MSGASKAIAFVIDNQGQPPGFRWRVKPAPRYQIVDAALQDDSMPFVVGSLADAAKEASRLGGRIVPVPGPTALSWGVLTPVSTLGPFRYLPETTPWNGRGNGEAPDFEFAVELVAEKALGIEAGS